MKLKKLLITIAFIIGVSGCGNNNLETKEPENHDFISNCSIMECMKQIEATDTIKHMNEVIGFGATKDSYSETYTWKFDKKNSITVTHTGENKVVQATIDKETIANENVDLSSYNEIKELLDNGTSLTYNEMVLKLGGVEGTIVGKTITSNRYTWIDKHNRTFSATFSNEDDKCTIINIR